MSGIASSAVDKLVTTVHTCHAINRESTTGTLANTHCIYQVKSTQTPHTCYIIAKIAIKSTGVAHLVVRNALGTR